jgi:pimeloyl-ACP methyl ester carboxylesterase
VTVERFVAKTVRSKDGTDIGYVRQGTGPGVVLVQGAMADVHAYRDLATELSRDWTVIRVERRGRGLSQRPYEASHDIARDVEDIDAVMAATGATTVFGLSSGGVITLEAARTLDRVERVVVFEPPFYRHGISRDGIADLNRAIEAGDWPSALVASLLTAQTAPGLLRKAPRPLARALAAFVLTVEGRRKGPATSLRDLLPGVRYDFHDVAQMDGRIDVYATVDKPVLLVGGTKSPAFLGEALVDLRAVLPQAMEVRLDGLGHDGPWNGGSPSAVAQAINTLLEPARDSSS